MSAPLYTARRLSALALLALAALVSPALAEPVDDPPPLEVESSWCAKARCPLTFTFSAPMVTPPAKGTLKGTGPVEIKMDPHHAGTYAWQDDRRLVFTPARGAMHWGAEVEVTISRAQPLGGPALEGEWTHHVSVPPFEAAGKVAWWPVQIGRPRFVAFLNDHSGLIGQGPMYLLFDQPVDPKAIGALVTARDAQGRPLKRRTFRPRQIRRVWAEKVDLRHVVAVKIGALPDEGESIHLSLPSFNDEGPRTLARTLEVRKDFSLETIDIAGAPDQNRVPVATRLTFDFGRPVRPEHIEKHLHISPKPREISLWSWDDAVTAYVSLDHGTRYSVRLDAGATDILGNRLKAPVKTSFRTADRPPVLEVARTALLLEAGAAELPVRAVNVEGLGVAVHRFESAEAFMAALKTPGQELCGSYPGVQVVGETIPLNDALSRPTELNREVRTSLPLPGGLEGFYCVGLVGHAQGTEAAAVAARGTPMMAATSLVQISDLALTLKASEDEVLAWVTGLSDGAPRSGAQVQLVNLNGTLKAGGFTDQHGVITLELPGALDQGRLVQPLRAMAQVGDRTVLALMEEQHMSRAWQFGLPGPVPGHTPLHVAAFTERGVYRPGESAQLKIIIPELAATPEVTEKVEVKVTDARGREVLTEQLDLDRFGTAGLEIPIEEAAPTGTWTVKMEGPGGAKAARRFQVEAYRVPTFAVTVREEEKKKGGWRSGQTVQALIHAAYLHGGDLAGRAVRYTVRRETVKVRSSAFPTLTFANALSPDPDSPRSAPAPTLAEGQGALDARGRLPIDFTVTQPTQAGPARVTVEAEVTDVDRQAYAGRMSRTVHPTSLYLGLEHPQYTTLASGSTLEVPVAVVNPAGQPRAGVRATVLLERLTYRRARRLDAEGKVHYVNHTSVKRVGRCKVKSRRVTRVCRFHLKKAGHYRVRALARDDQRRQVATGFLLNVHGGDAVAWPRFAQDRISVVADKASYRPGDTARLLVQTPFDKAWGLLTVEQGGIKRHKAFRIDGDTPALEVPITADDAPEIYASVVLVQGRVHHLKDAAGLQPGAPAFKLGYARLKVEPVAQRAQVEVLPARRVAAPGSKMTVDVLLKDPTGAPVSGQAVVMVVDEAVLGLTAYKTPDPVASLFGRRALAVRTGEGRLELPQARARRFDALSPSGDGGGEFSLDPSHEALRNLFRTTAFYDPAVSVGADGAARVTFDLPDNLTTYRVMAVVVDAKGRTGSGQAGITLRKPLMVQPVMPRFAYPDDHMVVEALVFNGTDEPGVVQVEARFQGLDPRVGATRPTALDATLTAPTARGTIPPGGTETFQFPVKVLNPASRGSVLAPPVATLEFRASLTPVKSDHEGPAETDRVQVTLPILDPGLKEAEVLASSVQGHQTGNLNLSLPANRRGGTGEIELNVSTTALTRLSGAVDYLMGYPNGCIEQTTSRAYPLVMLKDLLPDMGVQVDEKKLQEFAEAGVKRLLSFQTSAGGLAYWPGSDDAHAFGTAFGLTALIEAKERGFDVPDEALGRMADYLEKQLTTGKISQEMPHGGMADADTRALFVLTLGRLGRPQPQYLHTLWGKRDTMTPFGLAFLAAAVVEAGAAGKDGGAGALLPEIITALESATRQSKEEAWYEGDPQGGWSMGSPLRTHGAALLAISSLPQRILDAHPQLGGRLLEGLLNRQKYGLWGNTQENVFGIMGVARYVGAGAQAGGAAGEGGAPAFTVQIDGQPVPPEAARVKALSGRSHQIVLSEEVLAQFAGAGTGELAPTLSVVNSAGKPLTVTARAAWTAEPGPEHAAPKSQGFTVRRTYETLEGQKLSPDEVIPLGAVVRVRLELVAKGKQNYVAFADHLPAGLEPMNDALATTARSGAEPSGTSSTPDRALMAGLKVLSHRELRDERVAFFMNDLPAGTYAFSYLARATLPGTFRRPPAQAEAMYAPDVNGRTALDTVVIARRQEG